MKRFLLAGVSIFILWSVLDWGIHVVLLEEAYQETAELWRGPDEMKMVLMYIVGLLAALCFTGVYALLTNGGTTCSRTVAYGAIAGFGSAVGMGYGSYSVMPIPYSMALTWFLGVLAEGVLAGLILAAVYRTRGEGGADGG